ncbi:DUF3991 and toprim domain-containing protein [Neorhizobium galegae]|uniref:DUF3991 and toprim domain-containing protein n=1 Tax=Neorhizobium galegae TaxID=399 RepID=UPI000621D8FF|nr:DUF3991 and toprim domain-containing protein [Neorhizobium galegae]CDZ55414.1 Hypothetical protein NGAL_HAMBI2427_62120 [Neorhizobium galegae bv. orientalis]
MERQKIEAVRAHVSCAAVLAEAGFALDRLESSRGALKFRRGAEILIVTHQGLGWFDPLSERKGDVFALARLMLGMSFPVSVKHLSSLAGVMPGPMLASARARRRPGIKERWSNRPAIAPTSPSLRYLSDTRALPSCLLRFAAKRDLIREGPYGNAWFCHLCEQGEITGWEERGPQWRGFSTGGSKTLFRFGGRHSSRICITEAAIDALSLATLEDVRADTLYASTGGGWSPSTVSAIETIAAGTMLVAATDADPQGEAYADRLRRIAERVGSDFMRRRPQSRDWNEDLKQRREGQSCRIGIEPRQR